MSLINEIKEANAIMKAVRAKIDAAPLSNYYNVSYEDMYPLYHAMKPKKAEKFIEGWVATLIGGRKIERNLVPEEYKQNDNGDIWVGNNFIIGQNNIELKSIFGENDHIGGGQFRFYENVPYYMFFRSWDETNYELFLLSKEQLVSEIIERANTSGKSALGSSQGSGVFSKMSTEERIFRLHENVEKKQQDKIGWGFNARTEDHYYKMFKQKYQVNPGDVSRIVNGL